ncbi:DUF1501 domain-containing protein [Methylomagnum sp.]
MLDVTRRDVLKGLLAAGGSGLLAGAGLTRLVFAANKPADSTLVVIHLRGGWDGLNLISPASDPDFVAARISDLRVRAEGGSVGYALDHGPAPNIDFRLHPAAGALNELYRSGQLAFIHACGLTNTIRSHFVATDMIEYGVASNEQLARMDSGWLARALSSEAAGRSGVKAVSAHSLISQDLAGEAAVLAIPDLGGGLPPVGGPAIGNALWQLHAQGERTAAVAGRRALQFMAGIDARLPRDGQGRVIAYQPEANAHYEQGADLARPLKTAAQLLKLELGIESITLDYGGWDTHENQPSIFRILTERLSNGLAAFWNDTAPYHNRLVVVLVSEFGRRLRNNKSNGTDHGRGGIMAVLGGRVAGGRCYGPWPGLKAEQLDEGVDLAVTTDYRRVLAEVLSHHKGVKSHPSWFPGYDYPGGLGLFAAAGR